MCRSAGGGCKAVNETAYGVRITPRQNGLVGSMQDEKSQLQNRAKALTVMRSRLLKAEQDRLASERSGQRRDKSGGGGRREKPRTYTERENRVHDHRLGLKLYKWDRVLAGELGGVTEALVRDQRARQLAGGDAAR